MLLTRIYISIWGIGIAYTLELESLNYNLSFQGDPTIIRLNQDLAIG